jgi:hypothetical protein
MQKEPPPYVWAAPEEDNILTCMSAFMYMAHRKLTILFIYRELHNRKHNNECHPLSSLPYQILLFSADQKTRRLEVVSIMACCYSPVSTRSNHLVSRYVFVLLPLRFHRHLTRSSDVNPLGAIST